MNARFKLFKGSDVPAVHENDATFLQGEILLEHAFPGPLVMSLEGDERVSQGSRFKIQGDRSFQNEFSSEHINNEGHG